MRDLSTSMLEKIKNGETHFSLCWEIRRTDSVSFYYTEYDEDLVVDGQIYSTRNSGVGQSMSFSDMLKGNNSNIDMILVESDGLTLHDLYNFKYDNADVFVLLADTEDPSDYIKLVHGQLGETQIVNGSATINYESLINLLENPIGRVYSPECDAELFDSYCAANNSGHVFSGESPTGIDPLKPFTVFTNNNLVKADGWFDYGYFIWTSGSNSGISCKVKLHKDNTITLSLGMPNAIEATDEYTIYTGCDKSHGTCKSKFNNILNFKGFPTIPISDTISAYI